MNIDEPVVSTDCFSITAIGLDVKGKPSFDEWMGFGNKLSRSYSGIQFAVGDWINIGESLFGEKYAQALDDLMFAYGTLRNYASICARIPLERRQPKVKFHQAKHVAPLQPMEQARLLGMAAEYNMTGDEILEAVHKILGREQSTHTSIEGEVISIQQIEDNSGNGWLSIYVENTIEWEKGQKVTIRRAK